MAAAPNLQSSRKNVTASDEYDFRHPNLFNFKANVETAKEHAETSIVKITCLKVQMQTRTIKLSSPKNAFSIPREIVSDNGAQFANDPFKSWCEELKIIQRFTSVAHPQANGLCEVSNRDIVYGTKKRLGKDSARWVNELSNAIKPTEISISTHRIESFHEETNEEKLRENLNLIEERRIVAAIHEANNKQQIEKYHNKRVRALTFSMGEWVSRNNEASRAENIGILCPNWEEPYLVVAINGVGSYKLADVHGRRLPNVWYATLLKRYYA
ncbi:uncharacterized protein [Rutidosis leptorrhynchoides]|uniref:uncharacterized protein n=1 Tax=Rutidosis leptorrhynchoides TaxID=125765 RepID=UPI003A98F737